MKVEISIKDDRELRQHIRETIKGEVVAIARGEIREIIKEVFKEKYEAASLNSLDPEQLLKDELRAILKKQLVPARYGEPDVIREIARREVSAYIKEVIAKHGI